MTLPTPPSRLRPDDFSAEMDDFLGALPQFETDMNAVNTAVSSSASVASAAATTASSAATVAQQSANYIGDWSDLTGAYSVGVCVSHSDAFWFLKTATSDITADEPGVSSKWVENIIDTSSTGGAVEVSTGVGITLGTDRVQSITTTTDNLSITLPALAEGAEGTPTVVVYNVGSYAFYLYKSSGDIIAKVESNTGYIISLLDAATQSLIVSEILVDNNGIFIVGIPSVFSSANTTVMAVAALDATRSLICFKDGGLGKAVVATLDGLTFDIGTPVTYEAVAVGEISATLLSSDKAIVCYTNTSNYGVAVILSVSGTSITVGTPETFNSYTTQYVSVCTVDSSRALVCYHDAGSTNYGRANVLSVSGTTITTGAGSTFFSLACQYISTDLLDTDKVIIAYNTGTTGKAQILSISGTTITVNTAFTFESGTSYYNSVKALDTSKAIVGYIDGSNSNYGTYAVLSVSGVTITPSTPVVFSSSSTGYTSISVVDSNNAMLYCNNSSGGSIYKLDISGTSVSVLTSGFFLEGVPTSGVSSSVLTSGVPIVAYKDSSNSSYGTIVPIFITEV